MDRRTVLTKTAKGLMEVTGKTSLLPRDQRSVLSHVDGKATVGDLRQKSERLSENKLLDVLGRLMRDGFVREFVTAPASVSPPSQVPIVEEGADLDFTDALQANASRGVTNSVGAEADAVAREVAVARRREAEAKAKREADEKARREAEERARRDAEEKARREAEAKAKREAEERARREAEERARREAEEKAKREADEKAKREAQEKARGEAEEKARREAEARAKREAEERARREAEEKARREAEEKARREAEEKARREAEEKARREAEEKARREAEARARREAEERARREAEERARREAEERARREAEEKARRDAEAKAKREAEERARREAEAKAKREAEERARREAEEKAKREVEERARREAEEKARREAEEKARREAEERAAREAEEKARREAEAQAKREAEAKAKREAEEAERRDSEARIRRELEEAIRRAEQQSRADAEAAAARRETEAAAKRAEEEQAQREAEERAQRAAEEQARRAAEEQARGEAEEQARRAAEQQARLEAEERALREAEARAQREAEERAQREENERRSREQEAEERARRIQAESEQAARETAERETAARREAETQREEEERTRKDAERKARDEERSRAKAEAEAAARARKEERAREKASQEMRHSQPAAPSKAPEAPAAVGAARRKKPANLSRNLGAAAGGAAVVSLAVLQFLPLDTGFYERIASESLAAPVKIQSASFSLLPAPMVKLENVTIGGEQVRIANVRAVPELGSMFGDRRAFKSVEISGVSVSPAGLGAVLWQKSKAATLSVGSVVGHDVKLALPGIELPPLQMTMQMAEDGRVQKLVLASADRKLNANVVPGPDKATIDLTVAMLQVPFGSSLKLADFSARGEAKPGEVLLSEFDAHLWEGILRGRGTLKYGDGWSFEGDVDLKQAEAARVVPAVLSSGRLLGRGAFTMRAEDPAKLFEVARLEGNFTVQKGQLVQIDLARAMQAGSSAGTSTLFNELSGQGAIEPGRLSLRNLKLGAGLLSATGNVDIEGGKQISGKVAAEMKTPTGASTRGAFTVSGTLPQVVLKR